MRLAGLARALVDELAETGAYEVDYARGVIKVNISYFKARRSRSPSWKLISF